MTDAFIAKVVTDSGGGKYIVTPQITEHDGTTHPDITVGRVEGITPNIGDTVLILTTRNNLDNAKIQRYYEASEACGRIIAIVTTLTKYVLTGSFKFVGNTIIDGDLEVTGNLKVDGSATITGDATIGGKSFLTHTHTVTAVGSPTGPPL